jgi:sodium/potassium/calcium exchanger 6
MTLAFVLNIPTALLGATIFAIGQSSNDLVANTAVARRGMPVLAASATFGGPMMNMLMGIGGGGLVQVTKPQATGGRGIYSFQTAIGLFVSAACLLLGLGITLGYAFWNSWRLERGLGIVLIGLWVVFTIANVALSMTT